MDFFRIFMLLITNVGTGIVAAQAGTTNCNSTRSLLLVDGKPCVVSKVTQILVNTTIPCDAIYCTDLESGDVQAGFLEVLDNLILSLIILRYIPETSVVDDLLPIFNGADVGKSHLNDSEDGVTGDNVVGSVASITWADTVFQGSESLFTKTGEFQVLGVPQLLTVSNFIIFLTILVGILALSTLTGRVL